MSDFDTLLDAPEPVEQTDPWYFDTLGRIAALLAPLQVRWLGFFKTDDSPFAQWGQPADNEPMPHAWPRQVNRVQTLFFYNDRGEFRFSCRFPGRTGTRIMKGAGCGLESSPERTFGLLSPAVRIAAELMDLVIDQHEETVRTQARVRQLRNEHRVLEARQTELVAGILDEHEARLAQERESSARLAEAKDRAERASRIRELLLTNMSHELRTPLTAILGCTELLLDEGEEVDKNERRDFLQTIHLRAQHLLTLIQRVLDLSELESGNMECLREPCNPGEIILSTIRNLVPAAQIKGLQVDVIFDTPIPACAGLDSRHLQQAIGGLVDNAVKFTLMGRICLTVRFLETRPRGRLIVDVTDTGVGIPEDQLDAVFEPFHQADSTQSRQCGGAGLGLALTKRIVELMGGRLSAESTQGKGSTFRMELPIEQWEGSHKPSDHHWPGVPNVQPVA